MEIISTDNKQKMEHKTKQPIIVGLDIGTTKVVAIAGRKNQYGKIEILGLGQAESMGVTHGVVLNIDQCVRSIEEALQKCLLSNPKLEIKDVYVGIAGRHIKSHQTRGEKVRNDVDNEITKQEVEQLIKDQQKTYIPSGDQIIDIIPQDFAVDSHTSILNPVGYRGVKFGANFHIITADKQAIQNIKRCVDRSGLNTLDMVLQPLASAAAVINEQDLEAGVCIVDIGGGTTDMAVFADNMLKQTAVIPYAGNNITEDIREGLRVLRTQAEAMKNKFGMAIAEEANGDAFISIPGLGGMKPKEISVKNLAHIIEARTQEILEHVYYNLKQVNLVDRLYGGIILTGGGSQLKHIVQLTEFVTGINARIGYPVEHLTGDLAKELRHPKYATCIGLILRGFSDLEKGKYEDANVLSEEPKEMPYIHAKAPEETPTKSAPETPTPSDNSSEREESPEDMTPGQDRGKVIRSIFESLRKGLLNLFEEPGDKDEM